MRVYVHVFVCIYSLAAEAFIPAFLPCLCAYVHQVCGAGAEPGIESRCPEELPPHRGHHSSMICWGGCKVATVALKMEFGHVRVELGLSFGGFVLQGSADWL